MRIHLTYWIEGETLDRGAEKASCSWSVVAARDKSLVERNACPCVYSWSGMLSGVSSRMFVREIFNWFLVVVVLYF